MKTDDTRIEQAVRHAITAHRLGLIAEQLPAERDVFLAAAEDLRRESKRMLSAYCEEN